MIIAKKILTYISLISLLVSQTGYFAYAEELIHSLDELPSIQIEEPIDAPHTLEDTELLPLSELIEEKKIFDSQKKNEVEEYIDQPFNIIENSLIQEHETFIAQNLIINSPQ